MKRHLFLALACVLAAIALVAGTWMIAMRFQSPAQRQAAAQAPTPQPVLVEVTRGDLTERTTLNATASPGTRRSLTLPLPEGRAVLTSAGVEPGGILDNGDVIAWVNDRPVIALRGSFPLYRDLGEGDSGADVTVIQRALADLGYAIEPDGVLGPATLRALGALYESVGSSAPTRSVEDPSATMDSAVRSAGADDELSAAPAQAARTEVYLPLSEVLILPSLPVTVDDVPSVGALLASEDARVTVSDGGLALTSSLTGPLALRMAPGMAGTAQLGGTSISVTVSAVTPQDSGTGEETDSGAVSMTLTAASEALPPEWRNRSDVLVTLELTEPLIDVLLVPERALATAADGTSSVLVSEADGALRQVAVTRASCVSGTCALAEPAGDTGVPEGALVRVDR